MFCNSQCTIANANSALFSVENSRLHMRLVEKNLMVCAFTS